MRKGGSGYSDKTKQKKGKQAQQTKPNTTNQATEPTAHPGAKTGNLTIPAKGETVKQPRLSESE